MRSCCSSQKQNPFFSGNPQKFHKPFLGSVSVDEMLWVEAPDFWENSMQQKSNSLPFVLLAVDSSKSELFQIQFSNVMSCQWRLPCLEFHL